MVTGASDDPSESPSTEGSPQEIFRKGSPRVFSGSLIDKSALGSKHRDANSPNP